jgi:hypothetical protein
LQGLLVGLEEQVTDGILAERRQLNVLLALKVLDEEPVRDRRHDTGTVTISHIGTHSTSVGHVAEKVPRIADNLVAGLALDVASKADTASILLELRVVKTPVNSSDGQAGEAGAEGGGRNVLLHGKGARPRVIVRLLVLIGGVLGLLRLDVDFFVVEILGKAHARRRPSTTFGGGR